MKESTREILQAFKQLSQSDANEATTRLRLIDRILYEVLGWLPDDITAEERVSEDGKTTYADYILRTANVAIVIEAKKVGIPFSATSQSRRIKLSKNFLESELGNAIVQARDYARKKGIDFAVATNGTTWAIFPAQRHDQVSFNDSSAQIFWNLDEILNDNYQEFYDLLSRLSVVSGSLERTLFGRTENQISNRKLGRFFTTTARQNLSNPVFPIIENEIMMAFSDSIIELDNESFDRCYVSTPESMRFDHKIRMHINRREPMVSGSILRPMKDRDSKAFVGKIQNTIVNKRPLAILLLGTVGAGKTTFLHYMKNIRLEGEFKKTNDKPYPHWVYLDFLKNSGQSSIDFIYRALIEYIGKDDFLKSYDRCVKYAYADQIDALHNGPLGMFNDLEEDTVKKEISSFILDEYKKVNPYVDRILTYATKQAPFFLVIDNVDQIENEDEQSRLFTETLSISRRLSLNLILCLRQATFARHRNSPAIDAFDFEAVQIDPPKISSVLSKRFSLVRHLSSNKKGEFIAENGAHVTVDDASSIVTLLQGSVLGTEIGSNIEILATDDVRLALRMTREFLERGYTNPGKAIQYHDETGRYILPRHEAFRAIMLGTRTVYEEEFSTIGNPFDARFAIHNAQLLRLFVLSAVVSYASEGGFRFIDGDTICNNLKQIGFGRNFSEKVLVDLCKYRFLFTANHGDASINSSFIPSRLGGYVIRKLISNFTFIENVMFDTYISDQKIWQTLHRISEDIERERDTLRRLRARVKRARVFYSYMHSSFKPLIEESQKRGLSMQWCLDVMSEREADFRRECARVLWSGHKNYGNGEEKDFYAFLKDMNDEDMSNI